MNLPNYQALTISDIVTKLQNIINSTNIAKTDDCKVSGKHDFYIQDFSTGLYPGDEKIEIFNIVYHRHTDIKKGDRLIELYFKFVKSNIEETEYERYSNRLQPIVKIYQSEATNDRLQIIANDILLFLHR